MSGTMGMKIWQCEFVKVCDIIPKLKNDGTIIELKPQARYRNEKKLPLNKYGKGPFCRFAIPQNFNISGVYAIVVNRELK